MTTSWTHKDLLGLRELTADEINFVLETTDAFKQVGTREIKKVPALRGKTLVVWFCPSSSRRYFLFFLCFCLCSLSLFFSLPFSPFLPRWTQSIHSVVPRAFISLYWSIAVIASCRFVPITSEKICRPRLANRFRCAC